MRKFRIWTIGSLIALALICIGGYQLLDRSFYSSVYLQFQNGTIVQASPKENGIYYEPHIHPKGTDVIYFGNTNGPPRIWKTEVASLKTVALTPPHYGARHPAYSWDGSLIAFASDMNSSQHPEQIEHMGRNGVPPKRLTTHIFIMDASGHHIRQITFGSHQDQRPCFNPTGDKIAFVSNRTGTIRIWVVDINGTSEPRLIAFDGYAYRPYYSMDGKFLFFFTRTNGRDQIAKLDLSGGSVTLFANDTHGNSHGPFADPSGVKLLMHSLRNGAYNIWELPLDGSPAINIQPHGFHAATHATRSENGIMAFDAIRNRWLLREKAVELKRNLRAHGFIWK